MSTWLLNAIKCSTYPVLSLAINSRSQNKLLLYWSCRFLNKSTEYSASKSNFITLLSIASILSTRLASQLGFLVFSASLERVILIQNEQIKCRLWNGQMIWIYVQQCWCDAVLSIRNRLFFINGKLERKAKCLSFSTKRTFSSIK